MSARGEGARLRAVVDPDAGDLAGQLERVRLQNDTLYDVIGVIGSSPRVAHVLGGVVDVLTRATRCHACFVYLRAGDRLSMAAASPAYDHHVGRIEFGTHEGLAGWVLRRNSPAFIREDAMADPRSKYVPELEEEHFQSVVAVPIPSRSGDGIGVITLNTVAPREFDEGTLTVLSHAAALVSGAVQNAQLYEEARRRVDALTELNDLGQRIAAVTEGGELFALAVGGVRALLGCSDARLYQADGDRWRLELAAADPPVAAHRAGPTDAMELLQHARDRGAPPEALGLAPGATRVLVAPIVVGDEHLGVLLAGGDDAMPDDAEELLRAVANQVAVGLERARMIERLTDENTVGGLFAALEEGRLADAEARARRVRCDLERPCVVVEVRTAVDRGDDRPWPALAERVQAALRRLAPGTLCHEEADRVRARLPLGAGGTGRELLILDDGLAELAAAEGVVIGRSDVRRGTPETRDALREAGDAALVAHALRPAGGAMPFRDLGAYRYLVHVPAPDAASDPYLSPARTLWDYDARRGTQLLTTLEEYLTERGNMADTARKLIVHPNTLRQRLDRIETLTGLTLASADVLALGLAVKFVRLTAHR